jgi:hypothetical protein
MFAYLVRNLKTKEKMIFIAADPGTAKEKSGYLKAEVTKICEASYYLKNEKKIQELWLWKKQDE